MRLKAYEDVFVALEKEQAVLTDLYAPLRRRTETDPRFSKLRVSIRRRVDVEGWVASGEQLFDLRKHPFGQEGLSTAAVAGLRACWSAGAPEASAAALQAFFDKNRDSMLKALANGRMLDLGEWLFSTDHISVEYSLQWEGVDLPKLSPGARGVVLLTLYLGLDDVDQRPLIIDQPEENLDPRSVHSDLVPFFREAAKRRQIVMVTHNANLVVNTDSDQVIIAAAERTSPNELPAVTYSAGGLEDAWVRDEVCRLLEGGEEAFRRRGLRYGVEKDT